VLGLYDSVAGELTIEDPVPANLFNDVFPHGEPLSLFPALVREGPGFRARPGAIIQGLLRRCPQDLDADASVGFADLLEVLAAWGSYDPCPPFIAPDIDRDCTIGFSDVLALLGAWGPCP
jgi:hypothetical protein